MQQYVPSQAVFRRMFLLAVILIVIPLCDGYNSGSPLSTCVDMLPGTQPGTTAGNEGHAAPSQNDVPLYGNSRTAPYYIQVHGADAVPPTEGGGLDSLEYIPGRSYQGSQMFMSHAL